MRKVPCGHHRCLNIYNGIRICKHMMLCFLTWYADNANDILWMPCIRSKTPVSIFPAAPIWSHAQGKLKPYMHDGIPFLL